MKPLRSVPRSLFPALLLFTLHTSLFTPSCAGPRWTAIVPRYDSNANEFLIQVGSEVHAIHIVHPAYKDGPPTFTPMRSELRRIHAPVFDLFAAMLRGEDLKGYRRVIEPEPVWETAREIRTKLLERYEGAEYVGRIIEVENRLISPLWLKTERCEGEDVFAVLLTDTWLAASNPVPNDDMSRELPRQTRAYVVSVTPYWYEIRTAQEFRAGPIGRFGPIGIGPYEDTATGPMVTEKERLGAVSAPSGPQWDR